MKKIIIAMSALWVLVAFMPAVNRNIELNRSTSIIQVQEALGADYKSKKPNLKIKGVDASIGEDIIKNGFSKRDGEKKAKRQSKHFVCTSCHNVEREDPNLQHPTPEARLAYTIKQGLPFLQGTTLYGAVNRDAYYNGDYKKKYGALIEPARHNIREAIQLCAIECAQGRKLKEWELESILAYLWEIDLKIGDIDISEQELSYLQEVIEDPSLHDEGLKLISSKYVKQSDATFVDPPADRKMGSGLSGDLNNGRLIYEQSCLHCHYQKRYSFLHLDKRALSLDHLDGKAETYHRHSLYQVARYGTYSKFGKKSYMPRYTKERMSDQQLADLRAYIAEGERL